MHILSHCHDTRCSPCAHPCVPFPSASCASSIDSAHSARTNLMCHQFLPPLRLIFIRQKTQECCKKAKNESAPKETHPEAQTYPPSPFSLLCVSPKMPSTKLEKVYTHKQRLRMTVTLSHTHSHVHSDIGRYN